MHKTFVTILAVILLILGILGFVQNPLLGLFAMDAVHNLLFIFSGVLGLIFGLMGNEQAKSFSKVFGVLFGLLAIVGILAPSTNLMGFMANNGADNLLHLIVAGLFLFLGFAPEKYSSMAPAR